MVFRPAGGAADGIDVQLDSLQTQRIQNCLCQGNDLRIRSRLRASCHFQTELVEFPESACLGTLMPEAGEHIEYLLGQCLIQQAVLQHGTDGAGCALRPESELGFLCHNRVHFLLHHVGGFPHGALEQFRVFKGGNADFTEAVGLGHAASNLLHGIPFMDIGREDILRAVGSFQIQSHSVSALCAAPFG